MKSLLTNIFTSALILITTFGFFSFMNNTQSITAKAATLPYEETMIFMAMPKNTFEAVEYAQAYTKVFKEINIKNQKPVVIVDSDVSTIGLGTSSFGINNRTFFEELKRSGTNSDMIATWIAFPEANTPLKLALSPANFVKYTNEYWNIVKSIFPKLSTGILIDQTTYSPTDYNWEFGQQKSLLPYLNGLNISNLNRLYFQGFPWVNKRSISNRSVLDFNKIYNVPVITEALSYANLTMAYLHTGIMNCSYCSSPTNSRYVTGLEKNLMTSSLIFVTNRLLNEGFNVGISLFTENKAGTPEDVNWNPGDVYINNLKFELDKIDVEFYKY
jgi:hypothetical protein